MRFFILPYSNGDKVCSVGVTGWSRRKSPCRNIRLYMNTTDLRGSVLY